MSLCDSQMCEVHQDEQIDSNFSAWLSLNERVCVCALTFFFLSWCRQNVRGCPFAADTKGKTSESENTFRFCKHKSEN